MPIKPKGCYFRGKHTGTNLFSPCSDLYFHVHVLVSRVISSLQRQLVMNDFTPAFRKKLQDFYRQFLFPVELKNLKNRWVLVNAHHCNTFFFFSCYLCIRLKHWNLFVIWPCAFQPVCSSLGWYFAGDGAEGPKCFRHPKRRKKEGHADWRIFYNFPEKWTTAAWKEVQRNGFTTPKSLLRQQLLKRASCSVSAGTENCVGTWEWSSLLSLPCECADSDR